MNKTRLEAFSDGVFAIVITLLILDIRLPEVSYENLPKALFELLPRIVSYVMSFAVIGLYWVGHHQSFRFVSRTDSVFLWMNILLLLFVSFIPFPTSLLGKYPSKEIPVLIYGINLVATNVTGFGMLLYIYHHPELASAEFTKENFRKQLPIYGLVNFFYLVAIGLSFAAPMVSYIIYMLVLIVLIFVYSRRSR